MLATASVLEATAITAAGGGTVLRLDADSPRPGHVHVTVLVAGRVVQVSLDERLGSAVVGPPARLSPSAAPRSRRCALAHH